MLIFKLTKATLKALNKANNNKKGILSSGNLYLLRIINFNVNKDFFLKKDIHQNTSHETKNRMNQLSEKNFKIMRDTPSQ